MNGDPQAPGGRQQPLVSGKPLCVLFRYRFERLELSAAVERFELVLDGVE